MTTALEVIRGDDEILDLAFLNPSGGALNLTGVLGIWFTAKRSSYDPDSRAIIHKALNQGVTIVSNIGGTATVAIDAADTAGYEDDILLVWDAQIKDAAGKIRTAASGTLKITQDVTRATS